MCSQSRYLLWLAALIITALPIFGTIIELPEDYDWTSSWSELTELGVGNLTETDCLRTCAVGQLPRVCLYTFVLEFYAAMGTACRNCSDGVLEDCYLPQCIPADGVQRGMMSVNRQLPGPPINVCKNDLIVVNVKNQMAGTGAAIHWHGLPMTRDPWMDGVPYVTQCPIGESSFRYIFPAQEVGTYFWHSHSGLHRVNGHYGSLVIREPRVDEPCSNDIYDFDLPEHTIVLSDWMHETAEMFFPGLPSRVPGIVPDAILINGFGWYLNGTASEDSVNSSFPLATFHVSRNSSYRFRIINSASHICGFLIQIQNHNLTLIAADGITIVPVVVDAFVCYPGERYDFVINTNNTSLDEDAYWMFVNGLGVCANLGLYQNAVLSYGTNSTDLGIIPNRTRPTLSDPLNFTKVLNYPNTTCGESSDYLCITDLRSIENDRDARHSSVWTAEPDARLVIPFGFHVFDVNDFHLQGTYQKYENLQDTIIRAAMTSNITFTFPSSPITFKEKPDNTFCNTNNLPARCLNISNTTVGSYCQCTNVVILQENDIIELTLVDTTGDALENHPFHLHGYSFYVTHMGRNYTEENANSLNQTSCDPPLKDTISVPSKGFVTIRFRADNPGRWLFHCHFEWHFSTGMAMVFWVEGDMLPPPPGFPRCGDFSSLT
ncbi:oxidoreductase ptaE-like [Neodiprion virginianus]|uniref:oxidoreductase ptaE-like n=1 Tax=Neodiprion virginianus TaxID=2961670 RepID=UPI001EE72B31|nr:oxidoreductase ptaE-like [Neodiprion virginianus]